MADTPKQEPTPQAEPVIISAANIKNATSEKLEKERKDLIQKQLKQGVTDDKNSKNLAKILTSITGVLKGIVPDKNKKTEVPGKTDTDGKATIGSVIKGAVSDTVKGKSESVKSLFTAKGMVGLAAAKYAGDPNSIMGSVFSKVHEHLDIKDKAAQEKKDFHEGFLGGTDIGRALYKKTHEKHLKTLEEKNSALPEKNQLSKEDLSKKADEISNKELEKETSKVYEETQKLKEELNNLKAKAATLKSKGEGTGVKGVFALSKEDQDREKQISARLSAVAHGADLHKHEATKVNVPITDPDTKAIAEAEERDNAMKIFRKNNDITGEITPQQEKQFEQELKQNKEAKIRARDENNKTQLANESVQKAMDQGAFEKMRPVVQERAEKLNKDTGSQADISGEDLDKAKEDFYSNMFKDIMEELNTLSKDQLEELHAIRTAIEGDNKKDSKRESAKDKAEQDASQKIQKLDTEAPDIIEQNTLLSGKPITSTTSSDKLKPKDKSDTEKEKESNGSIFDNLMQKGKKSGGSILKKLGSLARGGAGALALGAAAPAALYGATELAQWAQDNPKEALSHIPGAPEKPQSDMTAVERIKDEGSSFLGIKSSAFKAHEKKWKERAEQGTAVSPEEAAAVKEKYGIDLQVTKPEISAPEKPPITPTKEIIDEKQDAVDKAKAEKAAPAPSVVNAPTVNNKTTNNNTTITREPIRSEDPNLPWRSALFN